MQSETQFYETVASGCPTEQDSKVYQQLILCHHSNRRASDCSQPRNDVNICNDNSGNVDHINDVTDASCCAECYCAGAEALVPLASSQAQCLKEDAEYVEVVASDVDHNSACGDSKLFSCQANCRDQHNNDSLQSVAHDDYLQHVALGFRYNATESSNASHSVQVKTLSAVVSLVVLLLVLPGGSVWLLLCIFSLPSNLTDKADPVTFCAIQHRPLDDLHNGVIDFDTVNINEGSAFDHSRLSARQRNYYWLAASADLNTKELSSLLLQKQGSTKRATNEHAPPQQYGLSILNQRYNPSISLSDIILLDTDDTVHLTSKQTVDAGSVASQPTASFLGFSINGVFDQLLAIKYEICSNVMHRVTAIDGESVVNVSNSNKTGSENRFRVTLQAPVSGVYLMTTSIHCTTRHQVNSSAKIKSQNRSNLNVICTSFSSTMMTPIAGLWLSSVTECVDTSKIIQVTDTNLQQNDYVASTSALINLAANNDQLMFLNVAGSHDLLLVRYAVQLLLYKPVNSDDTVTWNVVILFHTISDTRYTILPTVNEERAYDSVSNRVIVPVTGVYYLMLTVNAPVSSNSSHRIVLNSNTTALEVKRLRLALYFDLDVVTTDKSIMLSLATNDVLTYLYSELFTRSASFSGFLLYPK